VRARHRPRADWRFATTRDDAQLAPLLADFDQPVAKLRWADGRWTGLFRHVLKVFVLDGEHRVRNVYSVGFLNPDLVLNDLRTLLLERDRTARN
jgi:cytochrome c peroxidase